MTTEELKRLSPLELCMTWNAFCTKSNFLNEDDYVLLNEDRTYVEAFANEEEAMKEILNSNSPDFNNHAPRMVSRKKNTGAKIRIVLTIMPGQMIRHKGVSAL